MGIDNFYYNISYESTSGAPPSPPILGYFLNFMNDSGAENNVSLPGNDVWYSQMLNFNIQDTSTNPSIFNFDFSQMSSAQSGSGNLWENFGFKFNFNIGSSASASTASAHSGSYSASSHGISTNYDTLIEKYAKQYNVDVSLVKAVMKCESSFNPTAKTSKAYGLMQLTADKARELGVDRYNVEENIKGGVLFLSQLLKRFNGNVRLAVAAYNAGPNRDCYSRGEIPDIPETQTYVARVMDTYNQYKSA